MLKVSRESVTAGVVVALLCWFHTAVAAENVAPVQAFITIQDTEGLTEANLDTPSLKRIEQWIIQRTLERSKQSYANQGFDPRTFKPHVEASSVYIVVGGKKLGVVRLTLDHQVRSVSVLGFNVAISCVSHAFGQATTMYRYSPDPVAKKSLKRSVFQLNLRCHGRPLSVMSPNFSSSGRLFSGIAAEARRST